MNPQIEIWDLDILNAVKPVVKLGSTSTGNRKKRDCSEQCHTDSVLSLSWNRETDHLLASGGADQMVVLWDLDAAKPAQNLQMFDGMASKYIEQPTILISRFKHLNGNQNSQAYYCLVLAWELFA